MKKSSVILISFIYLLAISGIVVHTHYCGHRLVSWSVGTRGEGCGSCERKGKKKKCCKDKEISYKGSKHQVVSSVKSKLAQAVFVLPRPVATYSDAATAACFAGHAPVINGANAPPGPWQQIPLYKLHSSFTYYG